jgi:uncharacterized membrane protein
MTAVASRNPFELGKNRIEALGDGLFAVAMTLLVLSIKLPAVTTGIKASNTDLAPFLLEMAHGLGTYAIAFIWLGVYWVLHHLVYHPVQAADRALLWLSIFFFMFVSVLPLSVQLRNLYPEAQITSVIFGANLAAVGWLLFVQWRYVQANPRLTNEQVLTPQFRRTVGTRVLLVPVVATLTSLICFWSTELSGWIYVGMLPFYLVPKEELGRHDEHELQSRKPRRFDRHRHLSLVWAAIVLATGAGWVAFRPETLLINRRVTDPPIVDATTIAQGHFDGVAHETRGWATVYRLRGGDEVLRLSEISTSNGPDVHVFLVAAAKVRDNETVRRSGYIDLGSMKGNLGNQNYLLPADCDLSKYRSVTIWCDRFKVNFASAPLSVSPIF